MNITQIIKEYSSYEMAHGVEHLLNLKHKLSILIYECARYIADLEEQSKNITAEKKISLATSELELEGTGQHRKNQAIKNNMELINREAELEGKLKAYRIRYDGMIQIGNSMSSYLNKL